MFGEAWPPMSVPDLAHGDDDDDDDDDDGAYVNFQLNEHVPDT